MSGSLRSHAVTTWTGILMSGLLWTLNIALRGYLRLHLPSNPAVHWLLNPAGSRLAGHLTLVAGVARRSARQWSAPPWAVIDGRWLPVTKPVGEGVTRRLPRPPHVTCVALFRPVARAGRAP
jgi:hypothetical protein